ncbi:MAG: hypothetical protein V4631_22565 [Pseudomonadota bacterium]
MVTRFAPHGEFTIRIEGRILISDVVGPWNRELVINWGKQALKHAKPLGASGPYVGMSIVHGSLLCPPDAFAALRVSLTYGNTHLGCIGNVLVADAKVEGRSLLLPMYEQLYDDSTPHFICLDIDSARDWALARLAEKGY